MIFLEELVGRAPELDALRGQVARVLERSGDGARLPRLLLQGETGTGKGLLARAIHRRSPRGSAPFVDLNCGAIPPSLLEAELFGYLRGAFTDAHRDKPGLFQLAHGGTLFLDEVAALPLALQAKLLTALEDKSVRRLGAIKSEPADAWVISATHVDLRQAVREGTFREDLYHRLAVITFTVPPLRTRGADVLELAEHFLDRTCRDYGISPRTLAADAQRALREYPWPGNVRELANAMERAALLADGGEITAALLGLAAASGDPGRAPAAGTTPSLEDAERREILRALEGSGGNLSRTARTLGIARNTLKSRLDRYGVRAGPGTGSGAPSSAPTGPAVPDPSSGPLRWERRLLAYLQGSAAPGTDPLDAAEALRLTAEKARAFGGRVEEVGPTSLLAVFGLEPVEDATRRAALAAIASRRGGPQTALGYALHCEPSSVGRTGSGSAASIAPESKLAALSALRALATVGQPGEVEISRAAGSFLQRRFELDPTAEGFRLRGGERGPWALFSTAAPFVGREGELALLEARFAQAAEGRGQVVAILGEAGIGKSRLLHELGQRLGQRATWLESRCAPFDAATPLSPFTSALAALFGFERLEHTEAAEEISRGVAAGAARLGLSEPQARLLASLLGADSPELEQLVPETRRAGLFEAIAAALWQGSRERPVVLIAEDLHWADGTTLELLDRLVDQVSEHAVLVLTTQRLDKAPRWSGRSHTAQLSLSPLSREEATRVLRAAAGSSVTLARFERSILEKGDGNPFFLEELTRHALADPGGAEVPDSVEGVLRARIDRLQPPVQRWLQRAAVLGRDMPRALLEQLSEDPNLSEALAELCRLEFLVERRGGELYSFRHALTQEVAYHSLVVSEREELHTRALGALEAAHRDRLDDVADALAHHAERSRDHAKAVKALVRCAEQARGAYALADALALLERSRAHLATLRPDVRRAVLPAVLFAQAHVLSMLGRFAEALQWLDADAQDVEATGVPEVMGRHAVWRATLHSYLGQGDLARQQAARGLSFAERCRDRITEGRAHYVLSREGFFGCRFVEGVMNGRKAIELLSIAEDRWWLGQAHCIVSWNHFLAGELRSSLDAAERAAAVGRAIGDVRLQVYAHFSAGFAHACGGEHEAALARCRQACTMAADPVSAAFAESFLGYALLAAGELDAAVGALDRGSAQLAKIGLPHQEGGFRAFLAAAQLQRGELAAARDEAERALRICRGVGYGYGEGWALRVVGQLAQTEGREAEAVELLGQALRRFEEIESRLEAARTGETLAALLRARGAEDEARALEQRARQWLEELGMSRLPAGTGT